MPSRYNQFKRAGGSSVSDSGAFLINLGCRSNSAGLIIATVTIDNVTADVVIDTGATASFLPREGLVIKESRASLVESETITIIADNKPLDCTHISYGKICFWAGQVRSLEAKFSIINKANHILGYDALFGTDTIKAMNITISTENGVLVAKIGSHVIGQEDTIDQYRRHLALIADLEKPCAPATPLDHVLRRHPGVFAETAEGVVKAQPMQIQLTSSEMPKARLRRYSVEDTAEIGKQINSMLDRGIIEPSISPYSSTCHLVPKKNGQKRLVINFTPLNSIAIKDHYPLPQIADLLAHLVNAKYYCALDCTEGFWQIPVARDDRPKTAFITPQGLYQFKRCPFGFTNSPAIFQRTMNEIFKDGLYTRCVIYIDDILIFGSSQEEVLANLEWVLNRCDKYNVKLKLSKCEFLKTSVKFLGFRIGQGEIRPLHDKAEEWKNTEPTSIKEAQGFLGYINYYARFIPSFSERTTVLRQAIRKHPFEWTNECELAKKDLLHELTTATPQTIPSADTAKQVEIAVLENSIEATCLTESGELIMRTSASLSSTQKNYSSLEKELLALIRAYDKFGPFLRGPVVVKTSCTMLPAALKLRDKPERVARLLLQLPPDAEFKVTANNNVTEALKRMDVPPDEMFYTDGACRTGSDGSGLASWAVVATIRPELSSTGILPNSTSQKAEIEAVIQACESAKLHFLRNIVIVTDSKYVANAFDKWIDRWNENGWLDNKNKPVKNEEAFKRLALAKENLQVKVIHVRGHQGDRYNELADKMAREALLPHINSLCATIHSPPDLQQDEDEELKAIKQKLKSGDTIDGYYLKNEKVWVKHRDVEKLLVPKGKRQLLLQLAHSDPIYGAHYGVKKTAAKLNYYHWKGMGTDITRFVGSCLTCQKHKDAKTKRFGHLMPIKTSQLFNRVHMDFIGPLTTSSKGNKHIVTMIGAFSRMGYARPCQSATAEEAIQLLLDEVVSKHGPPEHMVTDNGTQFNSNAFKELMASLGTKHSTTCEYNPQANGMDEKFNGTLFKIIKNCVDTAKERWDAVLPGAVLAYNITPNESTKLCPYNIVYGRLPRSPLNPIESEDKLEESVHDAIRETALNNTDASHQVMEKQYNKGRQEYNLNPLDLIMTQVKSIGRTESRKFAEKWTGPHYILRTLDHNGIGKAVEILDTENFRVRRVPFGQLKLFKVPPDADRICLPGQIISGALGDSRQISATNSDLRDSYLQVGGRQSPLLGLASDPSNIVLSLEDDPLRRGNLNSPQQGALPKSMVHLRPSISSIDSVSSLQGLTVGRSEEKSPTKGPESLRVDGISSGLTAEVSGAGSLQGTSCPGFVTTSEEGPGDLLLSVRAHTEDGTADLLNEPRGAPNSQSLILHASKNINNDTSIEDNSSPLSPTTHNLSPLLDSSPEAPTPSTLTCASPTLDQNVATEEEFEGRPSK